MIGLPEKDGKQIPMLKYELDLVDLLDKKKHVWIKKATGLGISEWSLRYLTWSCLKDDEMKNKHKDIDILIICGPRIDLAITLMDRLKGLFEDYILLKVPGLFDQRESSMINDDSESE